MKVILLTPALIITFLIGFTNKAVSSEFYFDRPNSIFHVMESGSLHKKGDIRFYSKDHSESEFMASIHYTIRPRLFVPFPQKYRKGKLDQLLPIEFASELGYSMLEERGVLSNKKAELQFIGRETLGQHYDCYKIKVLPKSGKWSAVVWYHPDIPSVGWKKVELTVNKIPLVGKYTVYSTWKP